VRAGDIASTQSDVDHASISASEPKTRIDVGPGVWRAFDQAIEETKEAFVGAVSADDLLPFLDSLQDAVRCVIAGLPPVPAPTPPSISATQVLESVRRKFVDKVHTGHATDAQQAIHILSALGRVQFVFDFGTPDQMPDLLAGRDASALLIEIAHDMRSPLAAILFLLDMLRTERSGSVNALQQQQLRLIYGATLGIMQLGCDLIDSVRGADNVLGDRVLTDFSISETLSSVREIVLPMAEEKGVKVELILPQDDMRKGLPTVLTRILLNLTTNAIKFTSAGTVTVSGIQVSRTALEFAVQDSGRQIPNEVMEQLFRPFRRSDVRRARTFSSAGLGLSICHKLAQAIGSELRVTTSPNHGTRFHFLMDLPLADDQFNERSL
jgi:signal transduction histidine kinase